MFKVRKWERFQFMIDYEAHQVWQWNIPVSRFRLTSSLLYIKHKNILERTLPDALKLAIAQKIENNLFSKVSFRYMFYITAHIYAKSRRSSDHVSRWVKSNGRDQDTFCSRGIPLMSCHGNISIVFAFKPFCYKSNSVSSHLMMTDSAPWYIQLLLRSETRYYSQGTIIADSREEAKGLIVITSGQVRDYWIAVVIVVKANKI